MIGFVLALVIGLSLGTLGGGGSILTVPIFVYAMGYGAKQAIAMSLPVVGATSFAGAVRHWRGGRVDFRMALLFGGFAMIGAFGGARLAGRLTGIAQLAALGVVMAVAAVSMLRRRPAADEEVGGRKAHWLVGAASGAAVGVLTGIVGIGGGFLFVPALVLFGGVPMKSAIGTSLLVITMNTLAATAGYHGQVVIPWGVVAGFTAVAIVGILIGARIVDRVPAAALRRGFAYFLFAMAAFILYQNRAVFRGSGPARASSPAPATAR